MEDRSPRLQRHIDAYHKWYYDSRVWNQTTFLGVPSRKSVSDLWNYQEIIFERKPSVIIEFGTHCGGTALYFAHILRAVSASGRVITVDCDRSRIADRVLADPSIDIMTSDSKSPEVTSRLMELRREYPGSLFVILDSNHRKQHVLAEMLALRSVIRSGDYLVVEDGNINGHPVLPDWGEGPMEAIVEYEQRYPGEYEHDVDREHKFGFTFAPQGFLIRK